MATGPDYTRQINSVDLYIGNTVYYGAELVDQTVTLENGSVIESTGSFSAVRGMGAGQIYFVDEEQDRRDYLEKLSQRIYKGLHIPQEWIDNPFKSVNMKPKNNKAARRLLTENPEDL